MASNFNWAAWNSLRSSASTYGKISIAEQCLKDVVRMMEDYNNPAECEWRAVWNTLKTLKAEYIAAAEERAKKSEDRA